MMETKTYTKMEYHEWDDLVKKYFPMVGSGYTIVAAEELNNNSSWTCNNITKKDFPLTVSDEAGLELLGKLILGDGYALATYIIIEFFVWMDILPEGAYIINVSW